MKKLSVALVSGAVPKDPSDPYYSFVFDEAYRLAKKGLDVHAIRTFREARSNSYDIEYHGLNSSFRLNNILFLIKHRRSLPKASFSFPPWMLFYLSKYAKTVSNIILKNKLKIIHAHFAYPEGFVGFLAKKETGLPLVVTVHGSDVLVEPSIGYGVRLNKRVDGVVRTVLENADAVIAASNATYNQVVKITGKKKTFLIPNGVDLNRFKPGLDTSGLRKKLGLEDYFVVFSLRAHEPKYGLEFLIRAIPAVLDKTNNVKFIIGGDGSLRQRLEKLTTELGIRDKVFFTGKLSAEDVPLYYVLSDVVVVPSLQEAFGLAVSEAMACGKPVIGSNVGGIPDQIVDGYSGFLVAPKDSIAIAEKINWLKTNRERAIAMGISGRQLALDKFNAEKRIDRIIEIYKELTTRITEVQYCS